MQDYQKLRVWKDSVRLAVGIRRTANAFPRTGYSELKAQVISAAESIVSNIVEGCGADSPKDFARFLSVAIKSSMEVDGQLRLAREYRILTEAEWAARSAEVVSIRKMLYALRSRVLAPANLSVDIPAIPPSATDDRKPQ